MLRADCVIASLRTLSGSVLVFSHGQFGCSLAARWIGLPVAAAQHLQLDPASVSVLAFNPSHPDWPSSRTGTVSRVGFDQAEGYRGGNAIQLAEQP
nr:histidine phosphatase family protein [Sphingomonas paeninsulae]